MRDTLARIPGMGQVEVFGGGSYAMRVWLDPQKIAARDLTAGDVVNAIREQNVQVAAGVVGAQPMDASVDQQLLVNGEGPPRDARRNSARSSSRPASTARSRGSRTWRASSWAPPTTASLGYLDDMPAVAIAIFQAPGSNALQLSDDVKAAMADMERNFPEGLEYRVIYDPTNFVRDSIDAVIKTLFEALLLVVLVVVLFLQSWRASIIPLAAVPVSIIGTFAVLLAMGFSINTLSLFGLVLAIGIVVDDAIVVVENVERNIAAGLAPRDATYKAMDEVSGPIIAIALVLTAVFMPDRVPRRAHRRVLSPVRGDHRDLDADLGVQLTDAVARAGRRAAQAARRASRISPRAFIDRGAGWMFRPFNRFFARTSESYGRGVAGAAQERHRAAGLRRVAGAGRPRFLQVPDGFVPVQDKDYVIAFAQLPDAASLTRTEDVIRRMSDIIAAEAGCGVRHRVLRHVGDLGLRHRLEQRRDLRNARSAGHARQGPLGHGDLAEPAGQAVRHRGCLRGRRAAAAGGGHGHAGRIQDADRGSQLAGLPGPRPRAAGIPRRGEPDARASWACSRATSSTCRRCARTSIA